MHESLFFLEMIAEFNKEKERKLQFYIKEGKRF